MMIEFQCRNLIFDPATGHSVPCGKRIIVPDSKLGEKVKCPRCVELTEVPFDAQSPRSPARVPSSESSSPGIKSSKPSKHAGRSGHSASDDDIKMSDTFLRPKSDLESIDFGEVSGQTGPSLPNDKSKRCRKCGERVDSEGRCTACGFIDRQFEKATQPLSEMKVGLAGFQLWFVNTMAEAIPFKYLEYGAHGSIALIALMMSFAALFGMGGWAGIGIVVFILILVASYVMLVLKGHQLAGNPHARLAWYQKPLWNAILFLARRMNWQDYDQRCKGRRIIDCRGEGISDEHLKNMEGLDACEVLDLERTAVSDQGLRRLYELKRLHCVVLRKTAVTHEGVFRLQQTHPRLWIWY